MPTFPLGKGAYIMINSVDYTDSAYKEDYDVSVEALDNTVHGTSFHKTNQPGLIESGLKVSMYYSQAVYSALRTLLTGRTTFVTLYAPEGNTSGKELITITGSFLTTVTRPVTVDSVTTFDIEIAVGTTAPAYDTF
jgi:hypothetical protein